MNYSEHLSYTANLVSYAQGVAQEIDAELGWMRASIRAGKAELTRIRETAENVIQHGTVLQKAQQSSFERQSQSVEALEGIRLQAETVGWDLREAAHAAGAAGAILLDATVRGGVAVYVGATTESALSTTFATRDQQLRTEQAAAAQEYSVGTPESWTAQAASFVLYEEVRAAAEKALEAAQAAVESERRTDTRTRVTMQTAIPE